MKAWIANDKYGEYGYVVIYAETRGKAQAIALECDGFEDCIFTDIKVHRYPAMDCMYKGNDVADWEDPKIRRYLVERLGWGCLDKNYGECEYCAAKDVCPQYEEDEVEQ